MLFVEADQALQLLDCSSVADAIDEMLQKRREGHTSAPVRTSFALGQGVLLLMPAADQTFACVKTVTVHTANAKKGLPSIHGMVLLLDAATGEHLALIDGPTLTAQRTAALSLLGARKLIGCLQGQLLIVGAGAQARAHARAFWAEGKLDRIYLAGRNPESGQALATELRAEGIHAQWTANSEAVYSEVQMVITATTSSQPVISNAVANNTLVIAIGAFRQDMAELPPELVRRSRVYVDTLEGARAEAGDLIQAGIDWDEVTSLDQIEAPPAMDGRPQIFKTVGHALWDLAAAELVYSKLVSMSLRDRKQSVART